MKERNENRSGFKKTKAGWIPQDWEAMEIGELCEFSSGHGFSKQDWSSTGLPIIRIQNLNGNSQFNYFSGEPEESWVVFPGDMLYSWAGVKGVSFGPQIWKGPKGVLNQHIYKIHPKKGIDSNWLFSSLIRITEEIEKKAHGFKNSLLHVHKKEIIGRQIPFPPIKEQRKIANILSTWDTIIAKTDILISTKKNRKKALMQQLLFGAKRLSGFLREKGHKSYRFFDLPADWECPQIREIAKERSVRNRGNNGATVLSCSKHKGFVESSQYFGKQVYSEDTSNYKVIRRGWFGYPSNHIEEGSIGLLTEPEMGIVSPIYMVFQCSDKIMPEYLYAVFKTETFRHIFSVSTNASVDRRGSLRWKEFSLIKVPLPEKDEQQAIAKVLATAETEIENLEYKLESLEKQKRGLMQKLLTGEVRVKT